MISHWSLLQFIEMGGPVMWPLLLFSVVTVGLIIERVIYLGYHDLDVMKLKEQLITHVQKGQREEALRYLESLAPKMVSGRIFLMVFKNTPYGEQMIEKAVEAEAQERIRQLENGFNFLSALSSISPLTGFLGTVSGMIGAFRSIAEATDVNAQIVANGIYEALITTVFGLIIAIVAMVGYNLLAHWVESFTADVTKAVSDLIFELSTTGQIEEPKK